MKRIVTVITVLSAALLALAGCAPAQSETSPTATQQITQQPTEQPTQEVTPVPYDEVNFDVDGILNNVKLTGRTVKRDNAISLDWSYSGMEFSGEMEGDIKLTYTLMGSASAYIRVWVDDGEAERMELPLSGGTVTIANVERGHHKVNIVKVSEPGYSVIRVSGLSYNGIPDEKPAGSNLKIEIIGDSVTCGGGVLSTEQTTSMDNYNAECDVYCAYSGILSRNMKADVNIVALSGWGVARGGDTDSAVMPAIYDKTDGIWNNEEQWDFSSWQPDVVIIALGTNDWQLVDEEGRARFKAAAEAFLNTVREKNPDAYIIWMYGVMNTYFTRELRSIVKAQNDDRVVYYNSFISSGGGWGHPTKEAHVKYAAKLEEIINELMAKDA